MKQRRDDETFKLYNCLKNYHRLSIEDACKNIIGPGSTVGIWVNEQDTWEYLNMDTSAQKLSQLNKDSGSICRNIITQVFGLSEEQYRTMRVSFDDPNSGSWEGIYKRNENYHTDPLFIIVVYLPSYSNIFSRGLSHLQGLWRGAAETFGLSSRLDVEDRTVPFQSLAVASEIVKSPRIPQPSQSRSPYLGHRSLQSQSATDLLFDLEQVKNQMFSLVGNVYGGGLDKVSYRSSVQRLVTQVNAIEIEKNKQCQNPSDELSLLCSSMEAYIKVLQGASALDIPDAELARLKVIKKEVQDSLNVAAVHALAGLQDLGKNAIKAVTHVRLPTDSDIRGVVATSMRSVVQPSFDGQKKVLLGNNYIKDLYQKYNWLFSATLEQSIQNMCGAVALNFKLKSEYRTLREKSDPLRLAAQKVSESKDLNVRKAAASIESEAVNIAMKETIYNLPRNSLTKVPLTIDNCVHLHQYLEDLKTENFEGLWPLLDRRNWQKFVDLMFDSADLQIVNNFINVYPRLRTKEQMTDALKVLHKHFVQQYPPDPKLMANQKEKTGWLGFL